MTSRTRLAAITACFASLFLNPAASAQDGVWKVGSKHVIRFQHLDLGQPADRQALLKQIERVASRLCEDELNRRRETACVESAVASTLKSVPDHIRKAVETALVERNNEQQAHR